MDKITVLESASFFRFRLEQLFSHYGFENIEVLGSFENKKAKNYFADTKLLILDLDNRDIDIVALIEEVKNEPLTKKVEIILFSSQSDIKTLKKAIKAGCSDFVTKPFSDDLLIQKIHKLMNKEYKDLGLPTVTNKEKEDYGVGLRWQKEYEIGIEEIDKEHKSIIDSYEKLYSYMKKGEGHEYYNEIVNFLEQYVNEHFEHEEKFQVSISYDKLDEQVKSHREFKEKIEKIKKEHSQHDVNNMDMIKLNLFIKDWLLNHFLVDDMKIGEFWVKQKKSK